jgi:uncharacterized protein
MNMKEFIEYITRHLVTNPDKISITEVDGEFTKIFQLRVGDGELGKVIGRQGHIAKSMRILLAAMGAKTGKRALLEILDDGKGKDRSPADSYQHALQA